MLEPLLDQEFKHTGGWLKRKKLDEFADVSNCKRKVQEAIVDQFSKVVQGSAKLSKTPKG